jgi:butyryl-CoA dehydrogenase
MGLCIAVHNGVAVYPLMNFGDEAQIGRFLRPMAAGESIGTFCLTEPNAGSDPSSLETSAGRSGSGYLLNGNKVFVTNGGISKINLIFAAMNGNGAKRTFSVFLVESSRDGLIKGPPEELMGMRGNPVCPISLHDCWVPEENLLGGEGRGLKVALETLNGGRIGIAAQALGIAQACLDVSLKYAGERRQFGRKISSFGAVQNMLADIETRIEAARLLTYRACNLKAADRRSAVYSAMAKLNASETAVEAARVGVQIHGGYGYTKAYPVERYYRDAKVCEIYEGTSEVQRMVIARSLLGR